MWVVAGLLVLIEEEGSLIFIFFCKVVSAKRLVKNKEIMGEDGSPWYLYG